MNTKYVTSQIGLLAIVLSVIMTLMAAIYFGEAMLIEHAKIDRDAAWALGGTGIFGGLVGLFVWLGNRNCSKHLGRREALLLVAMSWIIGAALAAMPYWIWANLHEEATSGHPFLSFVDCYFEAMSGLTTTGATVLSDIEAIPRSLLLWRSLTHWLGGLGIVVLFVAVLPGLGVGGKRLFQVEAPGPAPEGLQPHIRETARVLWYIYCAMTLAEILALIIFARMSIFDSVCHTFATLATGGFSTRNASMGAYYDTPAVDIIVVIFMVLAGLNFGLYYQLLRRRFRDVYRDPELRFYILLLTVGSIIVIAAIANGSSPITMTDGRVVDNTLGESIRQGIFTTVSVQTTTGFATSDFNLWPFAAQMVLIGLMFVGGCSGSTGGGIKVIRIWVAMKVMAAQIEHVFRPQVIRPVRIGKQPIDADLKLGTIAYVFGIVILFAAGSLAIMLIEQLNPASDCSYGSAATASIATLCTIGPGLDQVGAIENYGWFSAPSKAVMCVLMALGRLEVFAIIVLFTPRFWSQE